MELKCSGPLPNTFEDEVMELYSSVCFVAAGNILFWFVLF